MRSVYFAYGSNLLRERIEARLGSCEVVGAGWLHAWSLRFHKRGRDGSGKCDIVETGRHGDRVEGVLYSLDHAQRASLDAIEGADYRCGSVSVQTTSGHYPAYAYLAHPECTEQALRPYHWYHAFVLNGARQHGLGGDYLRMLEAVVSVSDPDPERVATNGALLPTLRRRAQEC